MEHNGFRFDLFDVIKTGLKWKKYILGFAVIVAIITAIVFFSEKKCLQSLWILFSILSSHEWTNQSFS
jgi:hypothetical protein